MPNDKNLWKSNSFSLNKRLIFMLHKTTIWPKIKNFGKKEKFKLAYSNKHENVLIDFRISERVFYPLGPICDAIYEIVHTAHWKCVCESNWQLLNSFIHQLQPSKRWLCKQSAEGMKGNNWQFNKQKTTNHHRSNTAIIVNRWSIPQTSEYKLAYQRLKTLHINVQYIWRWQVKAGKHL